MKARVAVIKTNPEAVVEDYGRLMRSAGYADHLAKDKKTHVRINLSSDVWFPASSSPPWQLEGVVKALVDDGFASDSIRLTLNRSAGVDDRVGETNNGYTTVADRYGLEFARLHEPPVEWAPYEPRAEMLVLDKLFQGKGIFLPGDFFDANIVHLPTMKTRMLTVIAGAMENAMRGMFHEREHETGPVINEILVDLLAIQKEIHAGVFAVMDGTICGDGAGPRLLMPFIKDYLLAGADQVAIDAVAAHMMGFDPMGIRYIRLAHEQGLGCGAFEEIEIAGEDAAAVNFQFHGARGSAPANASRFYYDYFWYPFIGWPRLNRIAETEWGQLLQQYLPEGAEVENQGHGRGDFLAVAAAGLLAVLAAARMLRRREKG